MGFGIAAFAAIWIAVVAASWADAAEIESGTDTSSAASSRRPASDDSSSRTEPALNSDDDYSFKWLDPDKKIYVLQNRRYQKAGHVLLSVMGGPGLSNPYRTTWNIDPRLAFYFSEEFGLEVFDTFSSNSSNSTYDALKGATGNVIPVVREIKSQYGFLLHYVPWYAKINVFNKILYFDWYFSAGAGKVHATVNSTNSATAPNLVDQDLTAFFVGTGHQFHLTQMFDVRLDVTGAYYQASPTGLTGNETWYSNYSFGLGLGIRL